MSTASFLGSALSNPIRLDAYGRPVIVYGIEVIKQSLYSLLSTEKGTRYMLPEYGCRLNELVFEHNDDVLENLARTFIYEAIQQFEKRIKFVDVVFTYPSEAEIKIEVYYQILQSNTLESYVFPFYRELKY